MIDRNVPRKFVADKDERLLEVGDMIEAQNITITQRGEGSGSIVKTMKGTSIKQLISGSGTNLEASVTVIGKVEDPQTNKIYFFVASDSGHAEDMIVQYDPEYSTSGGYREVFRSTWLNFDPTGFVKANVVNKAFQQDGVLETILYFTDNDNPPRKINVDRALRGDYDTGDLDYALLTMRSAPTLPPTFVFDEDESVSHNNFKSETFQFATQYIYKDGEESALSPYSKLAVSPYISQSGALELSTNVAKGNVCIINPRWTEDEEEDYADVSKIRLLARSGNSGSFFIIEDFDPNTTLTRTLFDTEDKVIYDADTREYKFYNEGAYSVISDTVSQKLYDNVPQKAEGQSVVGNRLMYSNYTEGYDNHDVDVDLSVNYSSLDEVGGIFHSTLSGAGAAVINQSVGAADLLKSNINVDLTSAGFNWPSPNDYSSVVPSGTVTRLNFDYDPVVNLYRDTGNTGIFVAESVSVNDGTFDLRFADSSAHAISVVASASSSDRAQFGIQHESDVAENVESIADSMRESLNNDPPNATKKFTSISPVIGTIENSTSATYTNGSSVSLASAVVNLVYELGDTDEDGNNDGDFLIKPYVKTGKILSFVPTSNQTSDGLSFDNATFTAATTFTAQSQQNISNGGTNTYINNQTVYSVAPDNLATFKHGSSHDFGIVYFDKWGRSGFVNKIGSVYVKHTGERSSNYGSSSVTLSIDSASNAPTWAESFQVVYGGSQFSNVFTYTVGGGYYVKDSSGSAITTDKRIFVSLKTLTQHREETSSVRNYSFTEGDILRVISYEQPANTKLYASSNAGSIVEFEVMGVKTLDSSSTDNPIKGNDTTNLEEYDGDFLVLRAKRVEGGEQVDADSGGVDNDDLMYAGFDWFSMTGATSYVNDANPNAGVETNYWGQNCVVEILTRKKSSDSQVYYEIGEAQKIYIRKAGGYSDHGPDLELKDGDVRYRVVSCKGPKFDTGTGTWNKDIPSEWTFSLQQLEEQTAGENLQEKVWSKGRSHTPFDRAATVNRYNGITYSDAYADDTAVLKLSSFTPSLANFFDLPSEKGRCSYIESFLDDLICFQETKCSLVKVNKDVIQTGSQAGLVSLSTSVLNNATPFGGDFGTQNPESVLIRDGVGYAVDKRRAAIFRLSLQGLNPISDTDIKSFVESRFSTWSSNSGAKIVSGYDQEDDIYYVTLIADSDENSTTLGWDDKRSFWQGQYTFYPDIYASLGDKFFAAKYKEITGFADVFIHQFGSNLSNSFFGEDAAESKVTVVSNYNPSMVKQYNSISLEGDSAWTTTLESSTGQTTANLVFDEKEDAFYANVTGDTSSNSTNQYIPVGTVDSVDGNVVTMTNNLRGIHIPVGYSIFKNNAGTAYTQITGSPTVSSVDRPNSKITVSSGANINPNDKLFVANTGGITGDQIRGHYCKIKCSITPTPYAKEELYSINANFVNSKANHALGQQ